MIEYIMEGFESLIENENRVVAKALHGDVSRDNLVFKRIAPIFLYLLHEIGVSNKRIKLNFFLFFFTTEIAVGFFILNLLYSSSPPSGGNLCFLEFVL